MWTRTESAELALPVDDVARVLTDPEQLPAWHHFFATVKMVDTQHGHYRPRGWAGPVHARTAGAFRVRRSARELELDQPQPGGGNHVFRWTVAPSEVGCRVTQQVTVTGVAGPFFARIAGRPSARDLPLDAVRLYRLAGGDVHPDAARVVIAGGSGFLGRALASDLVCRGQEVVLLTRRISPDPEPGAGLPFAQQRWDARSGTGEWTRVFDTDRVLDVVNLAGKLVDCPPTAANIAALRDSRVDATRALVTATRDVRIRYWLQSSTTAIWSDAGDGRLDESSPLPTGDAALPQMTGVAEPWERAAADANAEHLVWLRTSIVLAQDCPAYDRLAGLAALGAGGTVGPGDQWFSWIQLDDWLAIARSALGLGPVELPNGVVVAATPEPVTNAELMRLLRTRLAPAGLGVPTPAPLLKVGAKVIRTDPALALTGRHVTSTVLREVGFRFERPKLGAALDEILS